MEICHASFPKTNTSSESLGYRVWIISARAMATFFAGVMRSSPYNIMEWDISIINTVLICVWWNSSRTTRLDSSIWKSSIPRSRWADCILSSISMCSIASPNWYGLVSPENSLEFPTCRVDRFPRPAFFNFPKTWSSACFRKRDSVLAVMLGPVPGLSLVSGLMYPLSMRSCLNSSRP